MRFPLALLFVCALLGGSQNRAAADWLMDAWRVEEGLPDNVVEAIAQTKDGYLWLGTQGGLVRFDGVRFRSGDHPGLRIERVRRLFVDRKDRLWVVGEGGDIAFIHNGAVKSFTTADGVPQNGFNAVTEDSQGRIWFSGRLEEGCFYFEGERFVSGVSTNNELLGQFNSLASTSDGTLYGARFGELWRLAPGEPEDVSKQFGVGPQEIPQLCQSKNGGAWLVANDSCYREDGGKWKRIAEAADIVRCAEDGSGRLWCAMRRSTRALCIATNGAVSEQVFSSRFNLNVRALFEDREGNWWWSTASDGLRRFRPRELELVSDSANLPANSVLAVAPDPNQGVWALIGRGLVRIANSDNPEPTLLPHRFGFPASLWVDSDETVWVGGARGDLFRLSSNRVDRFRWNESGAKAPPIFSALFRDAQTQLLIGSSEGLFRWEGSGFGPVRSTSASAVEHSDFRAFAKDQQGRVYASLRGGGLLRRDGDSWARIASGLPGDDLAALWCDAEGSLWIGVTGHGLARLRGDGIFSFQRRGLELPRNIFGIAGDQLGYLWLSSSEGIVRVAQRELNALADGKASEVTARRFDKVDGLLAMQCAGGQQPVIARSTDGKLWFATTRGLYRIDPGKLRRNTLPPPVAIEDVFIDDESVWTRPLNAVDPNQTSIRVEPHNVRLEFHFTALSLTVPQRNQFRYQLEGWDRDWQEAGAKRVAQYTRVRPGKYHFKVMASNNDGVWNETGARLAVVVIPPWWQTFWFRTSVVAVCGFVLLGAYRWRIRGLEREQDAQRKFSRQLIESQERERQRISAELHDSLGQSLLVVKNYAVMALKESTPPEKVRDQVREISAAATASIEEVRSIARALRPYQLDRFGLTKTLEDAAELLAKTSNLQVETGIANVDQTFSPDAEISIYRIVQEWLNNVIKHSQASKARLVVRREAGEVQLIMEDNGIGFDYAAVRNRPRAEAGMGLINLSERVRLLEGSLKIETSPGKGAQLLVNIPIQK